MDLQDSTAQPHSAGPVTRPALHRVLRFTETASVSVGVMLHAVVLSFTGVAAAAQLRGAVALGVAVAAVGVVRGADGEVRLGCEFSHAGSVYALLGSTLGPRPGFLA